MLDLSLLSPPLASALDTRLSSLMPLNNHTQVLAHSRRSAILTYASPIIDTANTLSGLPWYLIGWKRESDVLEVKMFEGVEFAKGWRNVPQEVKVVVEADKKMQFYEVGVKIVARFKGLR
jgi:seipin